MYSGFILGIFALVAILPLNEASLTKNLVCSSSADCNGIEGTSCCLIAGQTLGVRTVPNLCCANNQQCKLPANNVCCKNLGVCTTSGVECLQYVLCQNNNDCRGIVGGKCCKQNVLGLNVYTCATVTAGLACL